MATIILLDVDGVLNPEVVSDRTNGGHRLVLQPERRALVARLAALGRIVWATTWPAPLTARLTADLGLPADTDAISFGGRIDDPDGLGARMGKLPYVAAWLASASASTAASASASADVSAVVWIDDNLTTGAYEWARAQSIPFHLVRPDSFFGLDDDEVYGIENALAAL